LLGEDADVPEVAIIFGEVQSVPTTNSSGILKPTYATSPTQPALRFIEQGGDAQGFRPALLGYVHQIREGHAAIDESPTTSTLVALDREHPDPFVI